MLIEVDVIVARLADELEVIVTELSDEVDRIVDETSVGDVMLSDGEVGVGDGMISNVEVVDEARLDERLSDEVEVRAGSERIGDDDILGGDMFVVEGAFELDVEDGAIVVEKEGVSTPMIEYEVVVKTVGIGVTTTTTV